MSLTASLTVLKSSKELDNISPNEVMRGIQSVLPKNGEVLTISLQGEDATTQAPDLEG